MAVPVVFSLQREISLDEGLQFVERLASNLRIDSARTQLDGAQFNEQSAVSDLTMFVRYDVENPQAAQTILHTMGVEWRQLRDERSGPLADGYFDDLTNVKVSEYCLSAKMADARAVTVAPKEEEVEEPAHVSDEMFAKLSVPLSSGTSTPKATPEPTKPQSAPSASQAPKSNLAAPATKKSRFSPITRVSTNVSDNGTSQANQERPAVMRFVDFFEGLNH